MTRQRAVTAVLLALTVAVAALQLAHVDGAIRTLLYLAFALTAPGWAVTAVSPTDRVSSLRASVTVATSIAVQLVAAESMLLLGWHPVPAGTALVAVTGLALAVHLVRPNRSGRHAAVTR